jgi:hypothetical protein
MSAWRLSRLGAAAWTAGETAGAGVEPTAGASCPAHTALVVTTAREQSKKVIARGALRIEVSFPEAEIQSRIPVVGQILLHSRGWANRCQPI